MTEKNQNIISPLLFADFCIAELFVLVALKLVQAILPLSIADTYIMFLAILLNALFMLFLVTRVKKAGKATVIQGIPLAVFITLLADCFLVLLCDLSEAGLIRFISPLTANTIGFFIFGIVQVTYACYLGLTKRRLAIRIGFYLALIAAIAAAGLLSFDKFVACLSMSQLVLNLIYGWIEYRKKRTGASLLLAVGLTLFFGCDAFIMLRMLLPAEGFIYAAICFMVWIFYIPSQVVLTASYLSDRVNA